MKKILIIFTLCLITLFTEAQESFKDLNNDFGNKKGVCIIQLDKDLIDLYKRDNLGKKDLEILKSIEQVNIFTCSKDGGYEGNIEKVTNALRKSCNNSKYKLVKSKVDSDGFSKVYVRKAEKNKTELIVLSSENNEKTAFIMLKGKMKLSNIYRLAYTLKIDGLKDLKEINKSFSSRSHRKRSNTKMENFFSGKNQNNDKHKKVVSTTINIDSDDEISYDDIKKDIKQKLKNCNFEGNMENFEKTMEKWSENIEEIAKQISEEIKESLKDIDDDVMIKDNSYNIAFNGNKATIKMSPDEESVCIIDGEKVKNSKIKELKAGEINRVRVVKRNKTNENYLIITSHKKRGKYITPKGGRKIGQSELKFIYNGETYTYGEKEKIFPGYIINGKKKESLYTKQYINSEIIQIRPISKIEKKAFKVKKDRIVIETK